MHLNPNASRLAVFALVLIGALASLPRDAKLVAQTPARPPAPAARPADALITEALTKARAENKTVFIDFRASWCGPCGKLQTFLEAAGTGPVIQAHYVVVPLTVWETGSMAALNNPGAEELLKKWGGSAIPFIVWLDKNGTKVADSQAFGFPTSVSDVRAFSALLEKTAPRITPPELQTVATYLIARGSGAGWAALSTRRSTADLSGWFFPALSADGRYLADTAFSGEDVILRDMVTGAERRIAHGNWEGADDEVEYPSDQPAFSRDGRQLAYSWTKGMKSGAVNCAWSI